MKRREFPASVRQAALERCTDAKGDPRCEGCGIELHIGNIFFDHVKPDGLGGEPTLANCKVLCKNCHGAKTHGHDNPIMQKADRQMKAAYGLKPRKGRPMLGTKASGIRKRMGGRVERW